MKYQSIGPSDLSNTKINNEKEIRDNRTTLLSPGTLLSGSYLNMAIQEIRKHVQPSTYIVSPEAMDYLADAYNSSTWRTIDRTFRSTGVQHSSPNGIYIIPRFSGSTECVHWSLIVVEKGAMGCNDTNIDLLRRGGVLGREFQQFKGIFQGKRNFSWTVTQS